MADSAALSQRCLIAWAVLCFCSTMVAAQEAPKKQASATPATGKAGNVADPADLEAFFDGVLPVQMESKHIAGAVVAVVVGDRLVFSKGYGYGDIDARQKVDPDKTMFSIASITKLFTWTAVMQLYEQGKLDLDTDVNRYLKDVQIPAAFDQPITLKNLMTHSPGFDDWVIGLFSHKVEDVRRPLAQVLREQMPSRVRPPGVIASYSNHGAALAGLEESLLALERAFALHPGGGDGRCFRCLAVLLESADLWAARLPVTPPVPSSTGRHRGFPLGQRLVQKAFGKRGCDDLFLGKPDEQSPISLSMAGGF